MEARRAMVSILYNGVNASGYIASYLNSFQYKDVASGSSDCMSLCVNDRDRKWIDSWFPVKGDRLQAAICTSHWYKEGEYTKFPCGTFCVDDFGFHGGPIRMNLEALAVPVDSDFKVTERTETYEKTTLQEIGQAVAARAGIALYFEADNLAVEKVEQSEQTDCDFFCSLVEKFGLALKVYNEKLVVFSEADYEAKAAKFVLTEADFDPGWSWDTKTEGTYTGVYYQYTNSSKNKTFTVTAGSGNRILTLNEAAENLTEATAIALAAVNKANKDATTMTITVMAKPGLIASDCVEIQGLGKLSGKYYVEKVTHDIGSGYKMSLELRLVVPRISNTKTISSTVAEGG